MRQSGETRPGYRLADSAEESQRMLDQAHDKLIKEQQGADMKFNPSGIEHENGAEHPDIITKNSRDNHSGAINQRTGEYYPQ
ncbi:hypothetical protein [Desulfotalea psychrophila]|uniref:hypothetical protein n=1 Tax=Desulfotalea psychrophila TaxID=84980 RepID=UPI0002DDC852|nr:hypothetical protein [Desulfotalea psychrophila]